MVRRKKVHDDSDDEDEYQRSAAPPAKRARTHESDEDEDVKEEKDLDMGEDFDPRDDDSEDEERARAQIDREKAKSRYSSRGAAEAGVISSLQCKNFMCHNSFNLDFSQQINFITGRNGSGKSAALAAIQVGLGARPSLTGRGSTLQSLIQDGREYAEIIIRMRNRGPEAFKHDLYGDTIKIIRRIRTGGSASIQMKSADDKVISETKNELQEMRDHFNIQIESPLSVLTQDAAKKFLTESSPADKYTFFLQGTQLTQLAEEYELIRSNVRKIQSAVSQQKEALPQMDEAVREAKTKLEEAQKARGQKDRLQKLKNELAWAHVAGKYEQLTAERAELHQLEKQPAKYRAKADEAQALIDSITDETKTLEDQLTADDEENSRFQDEAKAVNDQVRKNSLKIRECDSEQKSINEDMQNVQKLIDEFDQKIEIESRKLERDEAAKRQQILEQLAAVVSALDAKTEEQQAMWNEKQELDARTRSLQDELKNAQLAHGKAQQSLQDVQAWQRELEGQKHNKLNRFGKNIDRILNEIQRTRWRGAHPPLGPLGMHVTLTDQTYREVLQNQIGNAMFQFVVSHPDDRPRLAEILKRNENSGTIVIAERDIFDFPMEQNALTPMHILKFTDDWVPRILVNAYSLERVILTKTRAEADDQAERHPGRTFWSADQFRVTRYRDGGSSSTPMNAMNPRDPRRGLFSQEDVESRLRQARERETTHVNELRVIEDQINKIGASRQQNAQNIRTLQLQFNALGSEVSGLKGRKEELEEQSREEAPQEVAVLENMRDEHINTKEQYKASFEIVLGRRLELDAENKPLVARLSQLRKHLDKANEVKQGIHTKIQKLLDDSAQAKSNHKHYRDKLAEAERKLAAHQEILNVTEEEYSSWHAKASHYCPQEVINPRNADVVRKEVESLEKAVQQRERRQGASVDELEAEVVRTRRALDKTTTAIASLEHMAQKLDLAVKVRIETWHSFRRNIALRTKVQFGYHLAARNFFGNLMFDHVKSTLNLSVMTADQAQAQGTQRAKEAKSLSGGEKSYTQVCLLLALWESVGCPIRCLDEFDVFLDAPNRGICMNLLAEAAKSSEAKQYFFITPLDTGNFIRPDPPVVKISQMKEPNRLALDQPRLNVRA